MCSDLLLRWTPTGCRTLFYPSVLVNTARALYDGKERTHE
jgi:hypothetical protein